MVLVGSARGRGLYKTTRKKKKEESKNHRLVFFLLIIGIMVHRVMACACMQEYPRIIIYLGCNICILYDIVCLDAPCPRDYCRFKEASCVD